MITAELVGGPSDGALIKRVNDNAVELTVPFDRLAETYPSGEILLGSVSLYYRRRLDQRPGAENVAFDFVGSDDFD